MIMLTNNANKVKGIYEAPNAGITGTLMDSERMIYNPIGRGHNLDFDTFTKINC